MSASGTSSGRFQNKENCNPIAIGIRESHPLHSCLSTHWIQWLDWVLREPTVTEGERCVPGELPERRGGAGRVGHQNRVQRGDLICWSRKEGSQTWKGFLEEVAFTLGLEETRKCGFFNMGEREVVCQLCWQVKGCQTYSWGQCGGHHLLIPGCPSNVENVS